MWSLGDLNKKDDVAVASDASTNDIEPKGALECARKNLIRVHTGSVSLFFLWEKGACRK